MAALFDGPRHIDIVHEAPFRALSLPYTILCCGIPVKLAHILGLASDTLGAHLRVPESLLHRNIVHVVRHDSRLVAGGHVGYGVIPILPIQLMHRQLRTVLLQVRLLQDLLFLVRGHAHILAEGGVPRAVSIWSLQRLILGEGLDCQGCLEVAGGALVLRLGSLLFVAAESGPLTILVNSHGRSVDFVLLPRQLLLLVFQSTLQVVSRAVAGIVSAALAVLGSRSESLDGINHDLFLFQNP